MMNRNGLQRVETPGGLQTQDSVAGNQALKSGGVSYFYAIAAVAGVLLMLLLAAV
jgi:hypothetical protein